MKTRIYLILAVVILSLLAGCKSAARREIEPMPISYDRPLAPGEQALRKVTEPWDVPDFTFGCTNLGDLRGAVGNSLNYLDKPSSKRYYPICGISHSRAVASLKKFAELIDSGLAGKQLNDAIQQHFDVYTSVGCDGDSFIHGLLHADIRRLNGTDQPVSVCSLSSAGRFGKGCGWRDFRQTRNGWRDDKISFASGDREYEYAQG
jgi:hypothetical protein